MLKASEASDKNLAVSYFRISASSRTGRKQTIDSRRHGMSYERPSIRLERTTDMENMTIKGYHAHVYFDEASAEQARALRERVSEEFDYAVGRFHEKNVGPHPRWSFQIAFKTDEFGTIVPWLALNRKGLTVFVHGLSGDDMYDHTELVMWLGESVELDLSSL